jgi:hypothetical protein
VGPAILVLLGEVSTKLTKYKSVPQGEEACFMASGSHYSLSE